MPLGGWPQSNSRVCLPFQHDEHNISTHACKKADKLACSARLAIAIMLAGKPALTTQVTMADGIDSLG